MWTCWNGSSLKTFVGQALCVGVVVLVAGAAFAQSAAVEAFNAMGFQKNRNYFSPEPYEHYDTVSGNVLLTFTDLTLPGNAGRSLQFQRTYNNQRVGLPGGGLAPRWSFGIAGMIMHIVEANPVPDGFDFNDDAQLIASLSPVFIMADNGRHPTMPVVHPNTSRRTVMSGDFHKYDRDTYTMYMADGTVAHYVPNGVDPVTQRPRFSLKDFADIFGNSVTLTYSETSVTIEQDLGEPDPRVVILGLVAGRVETMTFDNRVWQYTYQDGEIVSVTLPVAGPEWTFEYGDLDITAITTPNGGRIEYFWEDVLVEPVPGDMTQNFTRHFLHLRKSRDRNGVLLGTWTLTWGNQFNDPISFGAMIELPSGVKVGFGNGPLTATAGRLFTGGFGLGQRLLFDAAGQLVESESLGFVAVPVIHYSSNLWWGTPELSQRTVTRGPRTYSTQWGYDTSVASASSFPWNNHNPTSIVENNNEGLGRTWDRTYTNFLIEPGATTLAPYVLGLPATDQVTVSTDTFRRTWAYTNPMFPGFLTQSTSWARPSATGIVKTFVPDSHGNVATASTPTSSTSYLYSWGAVSQIATGEYTVSRVINLDGTVASETKGGRTSSFQYDSLGRPTVVTPPGGTNPTQTSYDPSGTSTTTTRGTSSLTAYLDSFGRPVGTLNSQGVRTTIRYDAEGRVEYRSLPFYGSAEVGTEITYDALDRVTREKNGDNTHRDYTYGPDTTTIVDEEGRETVHRFVAFGHPDDARLTMLTDAKHQPWAYAYDVLGRIRNVTAPDGVARTWEYNDQALLFRETHPESGVTNYQYNAGGLMTQKTDAKGQAFVYTYDGNDRVRTITVGSELTTFTYEAGSDNRTSMDVDGVHTEFGYDSAGRRASRVDTVDGFKFTTTFGYDNNDNLTSISYPSFGSSGNRRQVGYEYDSEHRLTRVHDVLVSRDFATNFSHHASGALLGYTAGNGVPSTFTYHPSRYWMTSLTVAPNGATPWSLQYSNYDDVGNVRSIIDSRAGMNQDLFYDELDRLVSVSAGPVYPSASWAYDIHGNRTNANGTTYTYYPGKLRLWTQNTDTYTYDNNGNLLTGTTPGRTFAYTAWNRVASATMSGTTTNYRYDADDWRVKKSSGTTTTYLLRGLNGELLTEWKNPGTNGETRDYIYAGSRLVSAIARTWNESSDWFGTIVPNGPPVDVNFTTAEQRAWLTFEGIAGRQYYLLGQHLSGDCLFFPLRILLPDGTPWISQSSCGSPFLEPPVAPVSGTYKILVDPIGWTNTSSVRLTLYDVVDIAEAISANGPSAHATLTPGQRATYTFAGVAGRQYYVFGERVSGGCLFFPLRLLLPDGTPWTSQNSCGSPFLEPPVAPVSGTYTIFVDPTGPDTGSTRVTLYDVTDVFGSVTIGGATEPVSIVSPGQRAWLSMSATAGQQVTVRITGNSMWATTIRLLRPDGSTQATATAYTDVNMATQTLSDTGLYTVVVDPSEVTTGTLNVTVTNP